MPERNSPLIRPLLALLAASLLATACVQETPAPTQDDEPPRGRLSGDVRPTAYRLDLTLDPRRDDFGGSVEIDVELAQDSDRIWLHGRDLEVAAAMARLPDGRKVTGTYRQELPTGVSSLRFEETLPRGPATLLLEYSATFDRNLAGLFKVEEQGDAYALAKSESIQARGYLPGFDEPGLKATFDIRLTIPEHMVAIGNAPETSIEAAAEGMRTVTFATTPPMSTYLLSLAVGPFDVVEREAIPPNEFRDQPIPLRGVARRGRGGDMGYVLDITPRMVEVFEHELRRPYPFRKLDVVAAPAWPSGATELSGAITYREQILLVGDDPPPGARRGLIGIHAHEIAHMWFGNLVTPPWWDDLWLKEGFATWATPVALALFEPDGGHEIDGAVRAIRAMGLDSLASTRAIREDIDRNEDVRSAYDGITYSKSLGVIHMVDSYFGAERFRPALGRYIETFADVGVANSADFYRVIGQETATPELTDTFRTFVEQKGVPSLRVEVDCAPDRPSLPPSLTVQQSRYGAMGSPISDSNQTWTIPFCYRTSDSKSTCVMLTETSQMLRLEAKSCPDWVMPNAGGDGYYRWTLSDEGWASLVEHWDQLDAKEALHVVDSAFAAFEAGSLSPDVLRRVVEQTTESTTRQVVEAPLDPLGKYLRNYAAGGPTDSADLTVLTDLYRPVLGRLAGSRDADDRLLSHGVLGFLARWVKDPESRQDLRERAHAFTGFGQERDPKALDSDLYRDALTIAVQDTEGFLDHLVEFRQSFDDPRFSNASAQALGRTTNPDHMATLHELAMAESTDPRETVQILGTAMAGPALRDSHWVWVRENFPAIVAKMPAQRRPMAPMLGERFCSNDRLDEVRQLFAEHGELTPGYESKLAQVEETIGLCIALRQRGEALIESLAAASSTEP